METTCVMLKSTCVTRVLKSKCVAQKTTCVVLKSTGISVSPAGPVLKSMCGAEEPHVS